jgi:hypothetical protein
MNKEDIIRLAIEHTIHGLKFDEEGLIRFANLIAQHEREACAKLCEKTPPWPFKPSIEAAHAIRERGQA